MAKVAEPIDGGSPRRREPGIRIIIGYKLVKGGLALALSVTLLALLATHATAPLRAILASVPHHFAGAWSVSLAKLLLSATEPPHLLIVSVALGADGVITLLEGWALHHGHWWGPWLVILTTSSLLPFEVIHLVHEVHAVRVVVLVVNLAIVLYLVRRRLAQTRSPSGYTARAR